jgi:flagellar motor protein MotB
MTRIGTGLAAVCTCMLLWTTTGIAEDLLPPESAVASPTFSFAVGFIRPEPPYEARVSPITGDNQTTGNKRLLGAGDQIYLDLTNPQEVAPGDQFTVYRNVKKVYHPARGNYLGDLTTIVGVVKVLKVTDNKATVKVVRSYDAIFPGDGATRQGSAPAPAPASSTQSLPDGTGMIVELPPGQTLIAQGHSLYVDWGRNDGVKVSDKLLVFRENPGIPIQIIGELQIIAVEDQTATARVTRSIAPILRGDRFAGKDSLMKQLGLDVPSPQARKEALFQEMTGAATTASPGAATDTHAASQRDLERELAQLARQLEFDPGSAPATAAGLPILKKIKALLKEVPDRRVVIEGYTDNQKIGPSLKGQYSSNKGFAHARGEIMGWLSASDLLHRGALFAVGDVFRTLPEVEWITGLPTGLTEDGATYSIGPRRRWTRTRFLLGANEHIQQESTFWRRSLWRRAGGRVEDSRTMASDFELWIRFFRHAPLFPVEALIGGFRHHRDSLWLTHREECRAICESWLEAELDHESDLLVRTAGRLLFRARRGKRLGPLWRRLAARLLHAWPGRPPGVIRFDGKTWGIT